MPKKTAKKTGKSVRKSVKKAVSSISRAVRVVATPRSRLSKK